MSPVTVPFRDCPLAAGRRAALAELLYFVRNRRQHAGHERRNPEIEIRPRRLVYMALHIAVAVLAFKLS